MINLEPGAGLVVAGDVRSAFDAVDEALLVNARMCVSVIETIQGRNVPAGQSQQLLRSLTSSMAAVVNGREEIVSALRHMLTIKGQSNLAPVDYGCPDGWGTIAAPIAQAEMPAKSKAPAA